MKLTPLDVKRHQFAKGFRGYDAAEVDMFMQQISLEWESMLDDVRKQEERVRELETKLKHYERVEMALQEALETARDSARRTEETAKNRAALIVEQAEARALEIVSDAERDRFGVRQDVMKLSSRQNEISARLRGFLLSELEILAQFQGDDPVGFIKLQPANASGHGAGAPAQLGPGVEFGTASFAVNEGEPEPAAFVPADEPITVPDVDEQSGQVPASIAATYEAAALAAETPENHDHDHDHVSVSEDEIVAEQLPESGQLDSAEASSDAHPKRSEWTSQYAAPPAFGSDEKSFHGRDAPVSSHETEDVNRSEPAAAASHAEAEPNGPFAQPPPPPFDTGVTDNLGHPSFASTPEYDERHRVSDTEEVAHGAPASDSTDASEHVPRHTDAPADPKPTVERWSLRSLVTGEDKEIAGSEAERDRIRRILDDLD